MIMSILQRGTQKLYPANITKPHSGQVSHNILVIYCMKVVVPSQFKKEQQPATGEHTDPGGEASVVLGMNDNAQGGI